MYVCVCVCVCVCVLDRDRLKHLETDRDRKIFFHEDVVTKAGIDNVKSKITVVVILLLIMCMTASVFVQNVKVKTVISNFTCI